MLKDMTNSELHAVMTGGFASISGSVLGAYILFGVRLLFDCADIDVFPIFYNKKIPPIMWH